jgi:hypothetical protein
MKGINLLLFVLCSISTYSQSNDKINISSDFTAWESVSEEDKVILLETSRRMINDFGNNMSFFDPEKEVNDDQKIANFNNLFADGATIFNYLNLGNSTNISISDFINNLYTSFNNKKLDVEIISAELASMKNQSDGFLGQIKLELKQYSGLDKKGNLIFDSKGRIRDLTVDYKIYQYDKSIAEIINLAGVERVKTTMDRVANFDAVLNVGIGYLIADIEDTYKNVFSNLSTSAFTYGLDGIYRRSINSKQSLFGLIGVNIHYLNLSTVAENLYTFDSEEFFIESTPSGKLLVDQSRISGTNFNFNQDGSINGMNEAKGYVINIENGIEINKGVRIGLPLGLSYRVSKTLQSRFFLDFEIIPNFIIWSNSSFDGTVNIAKVPINNFPDKNDLLDIIYLTENTGRVVDLANPNYLEKYEIGGNGTKQLSTSPTFDINCRFNPSYKRLIGPNWGISAGIDLQFNLLNLFQTKEYKNNFLEGDLINFDSRNNSLHEDLIKSNRLFNTSVGLGFYMEL